MHAHETPAHAAALDQNSSTRSGVRSGIRQVHRAFDHQLSGIFQNTQHAIPKMGHGRCEAAGYPV
jgi:hypothetical protein